MPDAARRYWAFLSYSHADRSSAEWLHRALEGFVVPRDLVGGLPKSSYGVYIVDKSGAIGVIDPIISNGTNN